MTVAELIERLKDEEPNALVIVYGDRDDAYVASDVTRLAVRRRPGTNDVDVLTTDVSDADALGVWIA